jgi:hypothetical protein
MNGWRMTSLTPAIIMLHDYRQGLPSLIRILEFSWYVATCYVAGARLVPALHTAHVPNVRFGCTGRFRRFGLINRPLFLRAA